MKHFILIFTLIFSIIPYSYSEDKEAKPPAYINYPNLNEEAYLKALEVYLEKGYDIDSPQLAILVSETETGFTGLMIASRSGWMSVAQYMIAKGADVNAKNAYGTTPLMFASANDNLNIAEFLINQGANVNETNIEGATPLIYASLGFVSKLDMVKLLIKSGADINAETNDGLTSLNLSHNVEVQEYLKSQGAQPGTKSTNCWWIFCM